MDEKERVSAYFEKEGSFREEIRLLRQLALGCGLEETFKWSGPVYCHEGKNVAGIMAFKNHCGLWFFKGSLMSDPLGVLVNAQKGKTRGMRHWKFTTASAIDPAQVTAYLEEAKKLAHHSLPRQPRTGREVPIPSELQAALDSDARLRAGFDSLTPYKQREYAEHIASAKRQETRLRRLMKIQPLIRNGKGLNDRYR